MATKKASKKRAKKSAKSATPKNQLTRRQAEFLNAVRATFANGKVRNIREACRIARVDSRTHYVVWMSKPHYAEAWEALDDEYRAHIRHAVQAETERRGIDGWEEEIIEEEREPVRNVDGEIEMVPKKIKRKKTKKYSDMLLALRNNQLFGDSRKVEVSGPGGGPVQSEMTLHFGAVRDAIVRAKNGDRENGEG